MVFSQLICQSGPQTSEHITVFLPDKSGWREGGGEGGRWGAAMACSPSYTHTHAPSHPTHPPLGKRTQMAQDSSSGCHSSRADVTWSLRRKEGVGARLLNICSLLFFDSSLIYLPSCLCRVFLYFVFLSVSPWSSSYKTVVLFSNISICCQYLQFLKDTRD